MTAVPEIDGVDELVEIGRGGFGVVYRGVERRYGREVAVKLLTAMFDEHAAARFDRELRAMGSVTGHPNIVTVFRDGHTGSGQPYLVMEFLPGGSMEDQLQREGPLDWRSAAEVGAKLADALEAAHAVGIVHRDVKPDNVFRAASGEPKLGDFGIARLDGGFETRTGQITASLAHAPPEVLEGQRPSVPSDVYSLASTIYTMVAGHSPFETSADISIANLIGKIATQPVPELVLEPAADEFRAVLRSALSKAVGERPPTAARFGERLRASLEVDRDAAPPTADIDGPPPPSPPTANSPPPPAAPATAQPAPATARPGSTRRTGPLFVGAMVVAALAVAAALLFLAGSGTTAESELLVLDATAANPEPFVLTASASGDAGDPDLTPLTLPEVIGAIITVRGDAPGLYAASLVDDPCDRTAMVQGLERDIERSRAWASAVGTVPADVADRIDSYATTFLKAEILVELSGWDATGGVTVAGPALLGPGTTVLVDGFGVPRVRCLDGSPINPPAGVPDELDAGREVISIVPGARMTQLDVDDVDAPGSGLLAVGPGRSGA